MSFSLHEKKVGKIRAQSKEGSSAVVHRRPTLALQPTIKNPPKRGEKGEGDGEQEGRTTVSPDQDGNNDGDRDRESNGDGDRGIHDMLDDGRDIDSDGD
ncbi:hypothetical protein Scep_019752 [Stephania cephalantha]|uniref:Uncharacterized protein n=1 Tax=Stephania cephalantha TaxID=152367 RepID=A0AAP0IBS2_9MAGN